MSELLALNANILQTCLNSRHVSNSSNDAIQWQTGKHVYVLKCAFGAISLNVQSYFFDSDLKKNENKLNSNLENNEQF